MHLRTLAATITLGVGLVLSMEGRCIGRADLDAAFLATFGRRAPLLQTVQQPIYDTSNPPKRVETRSVVLDVRPDRLVALDGQKYALISYEIGHQGGHSAGGEIAVSYLKRTTNRWTLVHLWRGLLYSGVGGQPANAGAELHRFAGDPLFAARSAWCGMGECSEWIGVIRLSPSRPIAYGDVLAGATSPVQGTPISTDSTCENYDFRARIGSPRRRGALFSIRYDGWTAAPGTLSQKKPLHLLTSYAPEGAKLIMRPVVPVPTCGR